MPTSKSASRHAWLRPVFAPQGSMRILGWEYSQHSAARGSECQSCSRHSVMCLRSLGRILGKSEVFDCWSLSLLWGCMLRLRTAMTGGRLFGATRHPWVSMACNTCPSIEARQRVLAEFWMQLWYSCWEESFTFSSCTSARFSCKRSRLCQIKWLLGFSMGSH